MLVFKPNSSFGVGLLVTYLHGVLVDELRDLAECLRAVIVIVIMFLEVFDDLVASDNRFGAYGFCADYSSKTTKHHDMCERCSRSQGNVPTTASPPAELKRGQSGYVAHEREHRGTSEGRGARARQAYICDETDSRLLSISFEDPRDRLSSRRSG